MTNVANVVNDPRYVKVLDHGFVGLLDIMGDDSAIDQAARCSYGQGTRSVSDMRSLIRYLVRNHHTSPLEMVELKFHLKMPIFVMRQHVRHRTASLNEYSGRYSEMTDEMYMPEPWRFQGQHTDNKQASGETLHKQIAFTCAEDMNDIFSAAYASYMRSLYAGLSRELARIQLPLANYTELYWKIDLKNFLHYVFLRDDEHAQYEIRVFAEAMYNMVKPKLPIVCEAFEDYWSMRNTAKFSRMELDLVKQIISKDRWLELMDMHRDGDLAAAFGISQKELQEFKKKLDL